MFHCVFRIIISSTASDCIQSRFFGHGQRRVMQIGSSDLPISIRVTTIPVQDGLKLTFWMWRLLDVWWKENSYYWKHVPYCFPLFIMTLSRSNITILYACPKLFSHRSAVPFWLDQFTIILRSSVSHAVSLRL